jgi:hypothetical protein
MIRDGRAQQIAGSSSRLATGKPSIQSKTGGGTEMIVEMPLVYG